MKPRLLALALVTALATTANAWGQSAVRLGERGQLIVTADRFLPVFGYTVQAITVTEGDSKTTTTDSGASMAFTVGREPSFGVAHALPRLAVDYTFQKRFTLGGSFALALGIDGTRVAEHVPAVGHTTVRENTRPGTTIVGFAPRLGYVFPLGKSFAFWPRAGFAFYSISSAREETSLEGHTTTASQTDTLFSLDFDPQFVWSPLAHVLVHAGPIANVPLAGSHETAFEQGTNKKERSDDMTVFHLGISAGLGMWFDL